ncbi:hypothetical protein [Aeromonas sp. 30P]|uniref:hypothetical protein n=1 Tax=Aeromonas sp. 30P TaxID=3452717 RepID=UPI003F7AE353
MIVIDIYFSLSRLFGLTMGQKEGLVMIIYGKYGGAALRAVHLMVQGIIMGMPPPGIWLLLKHLVVISAQENSKIIQR